jgi:glycosyltransferase involved in cell wall biosynthesis
MSSPLRSLYICYLSLQEPLVQTQVIAYLAGLARRGHHIHLITYENTRPTSAQRRQWSRALREQGIVWHSLIYHKRPTLPATVYDTLCGVWLGLRLIRRHRLDAVHARSHVPAAMGLILKKLTGCKLLFDIRGLLAEEYEDAGSWTREGVPFRVTKSMEKRAIEGADAVVVLTERIRRALFAPPGASHEPSVLGEPYAFDGTLRVIPCCADLSSIENQAGRRDDIRALLGVGERPVLIYVGKFGSWYMHREMVDFFAAAREALPGLHFLVLTQSDTAPVLEEFERHKLQGTVWQAGTERAQQEIGDFTLSRVTASEVGAYLAGADIAISFIRACPSKLASSPTKLGEYLAAGLPVISNTGVGDVDLIICEHEAGVLVEEFTPEAYRAAAEKARQLMGDAATARRCRKAAHAHADLEAVGVPRYAEIYDALANSR